jgi:hypothetical protein
MIESILTPILTTTLIALAGWVFKQNSKLLLLESRVEDLNIRAAQERIEHGAIRELAYSMDAKIDKRISESNAQLKELLTELKITLAELNNTVKFLHKEVEDLKHK